MAQALAADMLAKGLMPTDMVLLYAWAGEAGCRGFSSRWCLPPCWLLTLPGGAHTVGPSAHCFPALAPARKLQLTEHPGNCRDVAGCPTGCTET